MPARQTQCRAQTPSSCRIFLAHSPRLPSCLVTRRLRLHRVVVKVKVDVPRPLPVAAHKVLVARRALVLVIAGEHALQAHAHALNVMHGRPALAVEQVEADDAIAVDVRVHGDGRDVGRVGDEPDFGGFCGVCG
jgi:hypothetical protein